MHQAIKRILPLLAFAWAGTGEAATYYVRNGGNDSADGRTHGTAWASLNKVNNHSFAPGDIVLLHEGNRFVGRVTIDWGGTSSARSVLGAYYLDGSTPVRGYRTARPIIDGEDRLPTTHYASLVQVTAHRVRVENLRVEDSEGRGIWVTDVNDAEVVGNAVHNVYNGGIHFIKSHRGLAEDNSVSRAGVGHAEDSAPWGAAIEMVESNDTVVRNNVVSESFGEGINAHTGSQRALIERNTVFAVRAVGIYIDTAPDATVRRNIVLGTTSSTYWRGGNTVGAGIAVNNESYHYPVGGGSLSPSVQAKRAKIYGNLVAFTSTGVSIWGQLAESSFDGMLVFNNTLVDNTTQFAIIGKPQPGAKFINNILLSLSSGTQDVRGGTTLRGMVAKNNYFSQGDPGGDYSHAGNRYTGLSLAKMSGWRSISSRTQVSWRDFVLARDSAAINAGDDEPRRMADLSNSFDRDHNAASHNAPMDMGGLTFSSSAGRRPLPPSGLQGT